VLTSRLSVVTEAHIKSDPDDITSKSIRIADRRCGKSVFLGGHIASSQRGASKYYLDVYIELGDTLC
jgi:hypothetical protein